MGRKDYIVIPREPSHEEMLKGLSEAFEAGKQSTSSPWKRIARRLRSKYRTELAMEKAAHDATKQALIAMVRELADAVGGKLPDEKEWNNPS